MSEVSLMKLTEHIIIEVSDTKDSVLVETTPGITKLDASSLNKVMMALKTFYFEINPLSQLLWQFMKDHRQEVLEKILGHFESDPTISERLQGYLIHLETQITRNLSLIEAQKDNKDVPDEEDENSTKYWEYKRQRVAQAKSQWVPGQNPRELMTILAPNLSEE
ncbi:hypothetical protein CEE45_17500 [Candidatus Heimdallarchaeota archaeon B3_Heim]|nr:MAG: hypothetical protein CEE45_17500 [Candidatus Heimdallarchaeota archaeon B3_Heim]